MNEHSVRQYMRSPAPTIPSCETLAVARRRMDATHSPCLGVVDARGELTGVISRSDLVHIGRRAGAPPHAPLVDLPRLPVAQVMTRRVVTVPPDASLAHACELMTRRQVHQVFVDDGDAVLGVLGIPDVMRAICHLGVETPLEHLMSRALFTIDAGAPAAAATRMLTGAHISGVIVMAEGNPVGVFSQDEALAHGALPADVPVKDVMDTALLCLPSWTSLRQAAEKALAAGVHRIIACEHRDMVGVLSGLDFARAGASPQKAARASA